MNFYELNDAYRDLVSAFVDCESDEEAELIANAINEVSVGIEEKAENYAYVLQNMKADAAELESKAFIHKKESERLQKESHRILRRMDSLKKHLLFGMGLSGIKRIRTSIGLFYTQETTKVEVLNAWKVPEKYTTPQPPIVDKRAISKEFSVTGEIPEGCEITQSEGVRFR